MKIILLVGICMLILISGCEDIIEHIPDFCNKCDSPFGVRCVNSTYIDGELVYHNPDCEGFINKCINECN